MTLQTKNTYKQPALSPALSSLLLVDDEEMNRDMLSRRLTREGYTVDVAADGHSALEMMKIARYDMVLLDIMMPGMDGFQVLHTIKADEILQQKETFVIPDVLANAGGVIVSYFEWVQDLQNFFWTEDEVNKKLRDILVRAFHEVLTMSQREKVDMRLAALMLGVSRVARAMLWRGLYA